MKKTILLILGFVLTSSLALSAATRVKTTTPNHNEIDSINNLSIQKQRFLPTSKHRIDREINKIKFVYRGEVMLGMTASYGTVNSNDSELMMIVDNITANGTIASVKPFIGYFYRDNRCLGLRLGYSHISGKEIGRASCRVRVSLPV